MKLDLRVLRLVSRIGAATSERLAAWSAGIELVSIIAFSSEVEAGSRQENASNKESARAMQCASTGTT